MGLFQSNRSIKATDTYLSKSYNKEGIFKKRSQFLVQYVDNDLNVCKITKPTELYNLILPCFKSLADIKIAGIVKEFYRNDSNFKYSAQDFNLRQAILFLEKNQNKLNITIIKMNLDDEIIYQANINNRHNLDAKNEESEILMKENKILKRNLNLSNKYMHQARLQSSILLAELVNRTSKLKSINEVEEFEDEEEL